jgi:hypothetical protein
MGEGDHWDLTVSPSGTLEPQQDAEVHIGYDWCHPGNLTEAKVLCQGEGPVSRVAAPGSPSSDSKMEVKPLPLVVGPCLSPEFPSTFPLPKRPESLNLSLPTSPSVLWTSAAYCGAGGLASGPGLILCKFPTTWATTSAQRCVLLV